MIRDISLNDVGSLHHIVCDAVISSVATNKKEADFLITDILDSLNHWLAFSSVGYSGGYEKNGSLVGFIIIKDYWNLSHLFVLSEYQQQGIGTTLLSTGLSSCKEHSQHSKVQLNSSANAQSFYEASGFKKTGAGINRPGGCIPYEYVF